jgi:hypothetical protein
VLDCGRSRGVAQSGSAPVWGTGGRRFKSGRPDHIPCTKRPRPIRRSGVVDRSFDRSYRSLNFCTIFAARKNASTL